MLIYICLERVFHGALIFDDGATSKRGCFGGMHQDGATERSTCKMRVHECSAKCFHAHVSIINGTAHEMKHIRLSNAA